MINFNSGFNSISPILKDRIVDSILDKDIFEVGHRSDEFKTILHDLQASFRRFLNIPDDYNTWQGQKGLLMIF